MVMINEDRTFQAYYTNSTPIVDYMVDKLMIKSTDKILEPCGGEGVFIDAILDINREAKIDVCELNENSYEALLIKYSDYPNINVRQCDTVLDSDLLFQSRFGGKYDKIIANPPYGAWQDLEKRALIKKIYPEIYTKETYALFLFRCIELLKDGGILTFIIPDTFLNLHMHKALRDHILTKTKILELALFPSSFFPGVNFGYANLSIITLQKSTNKLNCLDNEFKVFNSFTSVKQLATLIDDTQLKMFSFRQKEVLSNPDHALLISDNDDIKNAINHSELKIGDIASCVTGFYSGNDKTYLQVNNSNLKNGKNYNIISDIIINREFEDDNNLLEGFEGEKHFVSIVKGGNIKFVKPEGWFMNWSREAVSHYKKDKKARFQNSQFYFKYGIGVPMISSTNITASLIENKLFDQSIVGIFPKNKSLIYYLLAFFNTPTCNKLIRTINPSANNPANYIKKIPFILPSDLQLQVIDKIVKEILRSIKETGKYDNSLEEELHEMIKTIYGF